MDRDRLLDAACQFSRGWQLLFVISFVSLVVLGLSLDVVEPGSATYVVTVIQLVSFGALFLFTGGLLVLCIRRE